GHPPPRDRPPPDSHPPPGHPPPGSRPPPPAHPPPGSHPPPPPGQPGRPPPRGLLDLVISWRALNGDPAGPAALSRVGPVTAGQALPLALTAATDPHARWQVIVTDADGYATATQTIPRPRTRSAGCPAGVTGQVTVTIPAADVAGIADASATGSGILAAVLRAARRAHARAQQQATADAAAPGGCAHTVSITRTGPRCGTFFGRITIVTTYAGRPGGPRGA